MTPNLYENKIELTPGEIVQELDNYIIGQHDAKRAVAIALRNRWRRAQLSDELRAEVKPKNILLIGPTGVGKTEIARRLAALANAPFIKVEATKFTEVGYVGRDVEAIIRDLIDIAVKKMRESESAKIKDRASNIAIEKILDALIPKISNSENIPTSEQSSTTREIFRKKLLDGELDDRTIEIDIASGGLPNITGFEIMSPPGMEEMTSQIQGIVASLSSSHSHSTKKKKMTVKKAFKTLSEEEAAALLNEEDIRNKALNNVEQHGIVFIDEIDKITNRGHTGSGGEVSREGVQRDLLPLVEGTTVLTKYGMIKTDHILFIASGAFHLTKPSDLIPELQGRFPIRVELNALSTEDFVKILTEPKASLVEQYIALLATEDLKIKFTKDCIKRVAEIAFQVNEKTENIGARRLYTIMERLLEQISFSAPNKKGETITIDAKYVNKQLAKLVQNEDLSRYIL